MVISYLDPRIIDNGQSTTDNSIYMRLLYLFLCFLFITTTSYSQSERTYSMFVFNKLQYNPAYAGSKETLNAGAHYRHQWQGVTGAPRTITAFAHTPFAGGRSGIGLSLISDEVGIFQSTIAKLDYAYRIGFKNDHKLSLGFNMQFDHTRFNWNKAELVDNADVVIPFGAPSNSIFNFGMGAYYTSENFYVGVSIPNFMRTSMTSQAYQGLSSYSAFRPNYLMGGLIFPVSNTIKIRPSVLISYVKNAPMEADFNLSVLFMDKFWIGASYRLEESIDAFVQFPLTKQIRLAIGVDYATTELNQFTKGSGEIMIEYLFQQDGEKVNNIRFF